MKSNFQIILLVVFIIAGVFALLVFSGKIPLGNDKAATGSGGTVVLWGTVKSGQIADVMANFNDSNPTFTVRYVQKSPDTFDQDLLKALASGVGPDMFFLPDNLAYSYRSRITNIPYSVFPIDAYKNKFASGGEVFLTGSGILAFPMTVDPLVMYYNRSILDTNGIVYPPSYWDEFPKLVPLLTKKDDSNRISQSTVALGQFSNISHAKDILTALFMQAGNKIVTEKDGAFLSVLGEGNNSQTLAPVLKFYTDFTDPLNNTYSWNRSLQDSKDAFSAESVVFYFGYASELQSLINKNPNENFGVAPLPQLRGQSSKVTSARMTGIAVSSFSKNFNTAFTAASLMSTSDFAQKYAAAIGAVPARRDLLVTKPEDAYSPTFYDSALYARSWLDPSPQDTDTVFSKMIDAVLSNSMTTARAIADASAKLSLLLTR